MRLGFDAKRLFNNFTGLGNYSRTLLKNLADYSPENTYLLFTPKANRHKETDYFIDQSTFKTIYPSNWRKIGWRTKGILKDLKAQSVDLYHGLSHEIPRGIEQTNIKSVVTIHDLIYRHYPNQYSAIDNFIYDQKFRHACQKADAIIAISESTKKDIQHFFNIPEEKIRVIYQSCDERFLVKHTSSTLASICQKYDIPEDFSLYVGSLIQRKNLLGIVRAMAQLPSSEQHPLVIIGGGKEYKKQVCLEAKSLGVEQLLLFRSVSFADLPIVYQAAKVFLYPSYYEGFGIPIIEALNSGTPVITSNKSSLPEAAGPNSFTVTPEDEDEIANAWSSTLTDSKLRATMIKEGLTYAKRFNAEQSTIPVLNLYNQLLNN